MKAAFQDWSTARTMNAILDLLPSNAVVLREGEFVTVKSTDIVPGDIVRLSIGDKVPADMRLLTTSGQLRFDRSAMTGESEEVDGSIETTDDNFLETRNIALMGTLVVNGSATGIVIFTGAKTVMGGIAMATSDVKERATSLQREITRFVLIICGLTVCLACLILFTWAGWLRVDHSTYMGVVAMLNNVMGCVVAFIPEGMPVGVALTLLMIARRMRVANVLPKSLATVEMLGCVEVLCSDKTGTLTKNEMRATTVGFIDALLNGEEAKATLSQGDAGKTLSELHRAALLCNEASFDPITANKPIDERATQGNPTDGALLKFAESAGSGKEIRDRYPQVASLPFNSKNKYMITLHQEGSEISQKPSYLALVKGAPDILLPYCTQFCSYHENAVKPFDASAKERFSELQAKLSRNAERVILLCQRTYMPALEPGSSGFEDAMFRECLSELTVVGCVGIFDPPRPEAAKTVAACRRAGIRFFMLTGDFGLTGAAIARQVGIFTSERDPDTFASLQSRKSSKETLESDGLHSLLLEGKQISQLQAEDWEIVCAYQEIVFGRCTPEQKLLIINQFRQRKIMTAVTGDGVNDAPALKAADVGVS